MHEQDGAAGLGRIAGTLVPQEQLHVAALAGPVLRAGDAELLVHRNDLDVMDGLLFGPDRVGVDHLGPFLDLGLHIGAERIGLHQHRIGALLLPGRLHVRPRQDRVDRGVEAIDDRPRRAGRCHHAHPHRGLVAGDACFRERRHVGEDR